MVPNCAVFTKRFGVPRFTLFRLLKASSRRWNLAVSVTGNVRATAKSSVCMPGPYTVLRPAFPKVYGAGAANASGIEPFPGRSRARTEHRLAGVVGADRILAQHRSGVRRVPEDRDGERESALRLVDRGDLPVARQRPRPAPPVEGRARHRRRSARNDGGCRRQGPFPSSGRCCSAEWRLQTSVSGNPARRSDSWRTCSSQAG